MWAFVRVKDPGSGLPKFVLINWVSTNLAPGSHPVTTVLAIPADGVSAVSSSERESPRAKREHFRRSLLRWRSSSKGKPLDS